MMEPHQKLWVEIDGRLVLSDYRVRLLKAVRDEGSVTRAAAQLGLSYRRAWGKIKELEENLGIALVTSVTGGPGGGQSSLTPAAERLIAQYDEFRERMRAALEREYAAVFGTVIPDMSVSTGEIRTAHAKMDVMDRVDTTAN